MYLKLKLGIISCLFPFIMHAETSKIEIRVDSVLRQMTLAEKVGQMNQLTGHDDLTGTLKHTFNMEAQVKAGKVGSVLNIFGAQRTRDLQKIAVEQSRLGIPLIFALDVIHGYKTNFPIPLAESCSWDMFHIENSARMAAEEATAVGLQWTFAPMVDIARDPRWGRVMEGSGEDPYLGSCIAVARVNGFQGDDLSRNNTLAACAKHFIGYGASEGGRDYNTVDISEQRLRELYLPPFQAAANAGVATFMNSFNVISGIPATANPSLVKGILKGEWKYPGVVVSDWNSVGEIVEHGVAEDNKEAALLALKGMCDIDMEGLCYISSLEQLVKEGKVSESEIDNAVRRILRLKFALGLFDDPYRYCDEKREKEKLGSVESRATAREMAKRSIVLLENRSSLLPLNTQLRSIAVIGPLSNQARDMRGSWSAQGDDKEVITIWQGIKNAVSKKTKIEYAQGCDLNSDDTSRIQEAVEVAKKCDVIVLCVGEPYNMSGEALCRTQLTLPGVQQTLIKELKKTGKPIVAVLSNGRPLVLSWEKDYLDTILETWYLGTEAGNAIADVLFGKYNPSGKLTMSFPRNVGQIPIYYNCLSTGRPFIPDTPYVTSYVDSPNDPLYSFGYGLSYTQFEYGDVSLSKNEISSDETILASVEVKNTGKYDGEEVVQLYIRDIKARLARPVKELKAFEKITLKKGEKKTVQFQISIKDLQYVLADGDWTYDPGTFDVFIGANSRTMNKKTLLLKK